MRKERNWWKLSSSQDDIVRCPYWFVGKVFCFFLLCFSWLVVSVECSLSVTIYWLIKMMLREEMVWFTNPLNMLAINWLVVSVYIREKKKEDIEKASKKKTSPPDHFRISYLSSFVFVPLLLRRWSAKKKKKDLLIEKKREKENWQTRVTTDNPLKHFFFF